MSDSGPERKRVIGQVRTVGFERQLGGFCICLFPSTKAKIVPGTSEQTISAGVNVPRSELEAAGIPALPDTLFFAQANVAALTAEEVQPSDFEPIHPEDLSRFFLPKGQRHGY